jgi:hypothetical protein
VELASLAVGTKALLTIFNYICMVILIYFLQSIPLHLSDANIMRITRHNISDTLLENDPTSGRGVTEVPVLELTTPD